jgi:two-component system NarL family sensor kinase
VRENGNLYEDYYHYITMSFCKLYSFCTTLLLLSFFVSRVYSQDIPDSLLRKLNTAPNDSVKARTLLDIGETMEATSTEKSFDYYQQALALSKKIKNNRLILSSLNDIGVCYIELNKMDSAVITFEQAIPVARQLNDTLRVARITANIGNVYLHKKDRVKAIEYYLQSAGIWETCGDKNRLAALYSNIGWLFTEQKEYDKAIEYGNKAYVLAKKLNDDYSAVNALLNLSGAYSDLKMQEKQYELLQTALPLAIKGEDIEQINTVYDNLGGYYYQQKQYRESLTNYLESYRYAQQMGNQYHLSEVCKKLSRVYHQLNEPGKALQFIMQAEKLANEVGARADLKEIYQARAEIEQSAGNYKAAGDYFSKTLALSDSLFQSSTSEKVAEVEAKYQNEKKQQEILRLEKDTQIQSLSLKQKSTLNYILIGSLAAVLIVGFLGYRNFRSRQQLAKQHDELQQQRIRELEKDRQLVAVDSLLKGQEEERSRLAKDLHDGLGGLLSGVKFSLSNMKDNLIITPDNMAVFERSLDMIDTSIKELRRVAHNMMPEMLVKFGLDEALKEYCNSLNATKLISVKYQSFGMDARMDSSKEIIIYRIVQELLNNILKHAAATETLVQLIKEEKRLSIVVEDNGKGFDTSALENNKGAGWTSIRSRVDYLQGQLDINSEAGKGTSINIEINA